MEKLDSSSNHILFVSDPHLGNTKGWQIFSRSFPNATKLIWKKGTSKDPVHEVIRSQTWLLTISFYNDFIFTYEDFDFLGLPLNLHPALPDIRGVGYDHIPLIENHGYHGGTLHFLEPPFNKNVSIDDIDKGKIIRTSKRKLVSSATYGDIRAFNQRIMLKMLAELCTQMLQWGCVLTARNELYLESEINGFSWSDRYIDRETRDELLESLYLIQPDHRVFNFKRNHLDILKHASA